jgi:predicted Zn-dependent protease
LIQRHPAVSLVHETLAHTAFEMGDRELAMRSAKEAIRLTPHDPALASRLSKVMGRPTAAAQSASSHSAAGTGKSDKPDFRERIAMAKAKQREKDFHGPRSTVGSTRNSPKPASTPRPCAASEPSRRRPE